MKLFIALFTFVLGAINLTIAQKIVVAQDGTGKFKSIQAALNSLDTTSTKMRTIYIKNGNYHEKIMLEKHFVKLQGESEKGVIVSFSQARDIWRCQGNPDDWGAATFNVKGHDIYLEKISILNTYGFDAKSDTTITCTGESGKNGGEKAKFALPREANEIVGTTIVRKDGHQFALRSFAGATRLIFKQCTFRAFGGDTVSPWDAESGMYYFKDCTLEGGVDLYCPRGWALAENCHFICHSMNAAIWHDGTNHESGKTVLKNCTFVGDKGYKLGRFHRPAQFYLLDCQFDENMADANIYHVSSSPEPTWGYRVYYQNCHRIGGDFAWHKDNLTISPKKITKEWIYDKQWNPK